MPMAELYHGSRRLDYGYCSSRGEYVFDVREPGTYRVRVTLPGFAAPDQDIMITSGMRYQLFFELHPSESSEAGAAPTPRGPPPPEVIERMVKSRQLRASGDSEGAIQYMERAVEMAPEFTSARLELGLYYWRAKRLDEARASFEKVRELDPAKTSAYLCLGQVLSEMGLQTEATETLLQASQMLPDRAEPLFALAKMYADAGDQTKAEETATRALERDCSTVPQIHLLLAGLHAEKGDLEGEIASVEAYLAIAPANADLSRIEKRLELLEAELTLKPSMDQYFSVLENYKNGDRAEALDRLAELPNIAVYRGVEYLRDRDDGQLLQAALMHTDAALRPGGNASLHVSRAATCLKRIDDDSLRDELDRKWSLAMAYYFQNDHRFLVSVPFLMDLNKRYPEDSEIRLAFGSVCEASGLLHEGFRDHLETAEEQYRWILAADPNHIEASLRLGHVLKLRGQHEESLSILESVLSRTEDPSQTFIARLLLGDIHRSQGRLETAIALYESAVQIDPDCLVASVAMSHALHESRRLGESTEVLELLMARSDPSRDDTWWRYLMGHSERFGPLLQELRQEGARH